MFPKAHTKFLYLAIPQQLPQGFKIFHLSNEIYYFISWVIQKLLENKHWFKAQIPRNLECVNIVTLPSWAFYSTILHSTIASLYYKKHHHIWLCTRKQRSILLWEKFYVTGWGIIQHFRLTYDLTFQANDRPDPRLYVN